MALGIILRRSASRIIGGETRRYFRNFSTALDKSRLVHDSEADRLVGSNETVPGGEKQKEQFLKEIASEITHAVKLSHLSTELPDDFPFKLEKDVPGTPVISLSRAYKGERIDVNVYPPKDDKFNLYKNYSTVRLTVEVRCAISNATKAVFDCFIMNYGFVIKEVKNHQDDNEALRFRDLKKEFKTYLEINEDLKEEFKTYLEMRGITPTTTSVLYGLMVDKVNREKLRFFDEFKKMLEA